VVSFLMIDFVIVGGRAGGNKSTYSESMF